MQATRPSALLLLHEISRQFSGVLEQCARQTASGLIEADLEGAVLETAAARGQRAVNAAHFDSLGDQQTGQPFGAPAIGGQVEENRLRSTFILGRRDPEIEIVAHKALAIGGHHFGRRQAGDVVMLDRFAISQKRAIAPAPDQTPRRGLFIGHRHGTLQGRPHIAIAGIEGIKDFTSEIIIAELVKPAAVIAPDQVLGVALALDHMRVEGLGRWRKEITAVAAHFMRIDDDHRTPVQHRRNAAACFWLGHRKPVAIHVKQIVVGATTRPGLVMLGSETVLVGLQATCGSKTVHKARPPIGVLDRINNDNGLVEDPVDTGIIARCEQVIGGAQAGIGRGNLIAMHAIGEPDHGRRRGDQAVAHVSGQSAGVCQLLQIGLDVIEARHGVRIGDDGVGERAAFPAGRVVNDLNAVGGSCLQGPEIGNRLIGRCDFSTKFMTQYRLRGRNLRIVLAGQRRRLRQRRYRRHHQTDQGPEQMLHHGIPVYPAASKAGFSRPVKALLLWVCGTPGRKISARARFSASAQGRSFTIPRPCASAFFAGLLRVDRRLSLTSNCLRDGDTHDGGQILGKGPGCSRSDGPGCSRCAGCAR